MLALKENQNLREIFHFQKLFDLYKFKKNITPLYSVVEFFIIVFGAGIKLFRVEWNLRTP
jgi:hypothetical protein